MQFERQHSLLPTPYSGIAIYADLSQHTMMARKKLVPLTKLLRNNHLAYSWGFPTKLLVVKDGRTYLIFGRGTPTHQKMGPTTTR